MLAGRVLGDVPIRSAHSSAAYREKHISLSARVRAASGLGKLAAGRGRHPWHDFVQSVTQAAPTDAAHCQRRLGADRRVSSEGRGPWRVSNLGGQWRPLALDASAGDELRAGECAAHARRARTVERAALGRREACARPARARTDARAQYSYSAAVVDQYKSVTSAGWVKYQSCTSVLPAQCKCSTSTVSVECQPSTIGEQYCCSAQDG